VSGIELIGGRLLCGEAVLDVAATPPGRHVLDPGGGHGSAHLGPRVVLGADGGLRRVRAHSRPDGRVEVRIDPAAPRAEAVRLRTEAFWLVVTSDPGGVLVAVREDGEAVVRGRRDRIDLEALARAAAQPARWNLWVERADGRRLRLARHRDGVAGKHGGTALPGWSSDGLTARPCFTAEDGLTVVTGPAAEPLPARRARRVSLRRRLLIGPALLVHGLATVLLRLAPPVRRSDPEKVRIVVGDAWAMGGTIRASLDLAARLAQTRPVEVVSLVRHRRRPFFAFPDGVTVRALDDRTQRARGLARLARRVPSVLVHPEDHAQPWGSMLADVRLARVLRRSRGVVVTTRPAFAIAAVAACRRGARVLAQEHQHLSAHRPRLARAARRAFARADALVVLTERDREDYAAALGPRARVVRIPNALTELGPALASADAKVIVAAGRLNRQKGFDLLIRAFGLIAPAHPDWTLRIHGNGPERRALERVIDDAQVHDQVLLLPPARRMGDALAEGSVFALSSRFEGFGMVLVEAMSRGLAVVSFACPRGPAEIVTAGRDGLLVQPESVIGMARALDAAMHDPGLRARLGAQARRSARRYAPAVVGALWDELLVGDARRDLGGLGGEEVLRGAGDPPLELGGAVGGVPGERLRGAGAQAAAAVGGGSGEPQQVAALLEQREQLARGPGEAPSLL
jgi:glycosyltransferase involved in cell wall biosynthesis